MTARRTAGSGRAPRHPADLAAGRFEPRCPACAPAAEHRDGHRGRAARPAQRLRREQGRAGAPGGELGPADRRGRGRAPLPQRVRPPDAAGHAVLRGGRDLPLLAGARGPAAGVRGRRPAAGLRARPRRGPGQPAGPAGGQPGGRRHRSRGAPTPAGCAATTSRAASRTRWARWPRRWPRPSAAGIEPVVTGEYRLGDVRHVVASPAAAAADLGFRAQTGFAEGMAEFAHAPLREAASLAAARA